MLMSEGEKQFPEDSFMYSVSLLSSKILFEHVEDIESLVEGDPNAIVYPTETILRTNSVMAFCSPQFSARFSEVCYISCLSPFVLTVCCLPCLAGQSVPPSHNSFIGSEPKKKSFVQQRIALMNSGIAMMGGYHGGGRASGGQAGVVGTAAPSAAYYAGSRLSVTSHCHVLSPSSVISFWYFYLHCPITQLHFEVILMHLSIQPLHEVTPPPPRGTLGTNWSNRKNILFTRLKVHRQLPKLTSHHQ